MSKLYLIPTPIGNLEDVTYRAVRILKEEVDLVLAEDTRISKRLFQHYGIDRPMKPHHQKNEHRGAPGWAKAMKEGQRIAYLTDAGTPGISDPGYLLVREALKAGVEVEALPGPVAFIPALVVSGLPCDRFRFEGFLPHKKGRQKRLKLLAGEERTLVLYESPHRMERVLNELCEHLGETRPASVSREISKLHEETVRASLGELRSHFKDGAARGEFVIIVAGKEADSS